MKPLVIIAGPTGVGKTELSLKLAKAINGEIISADSMQIYKELDIGTAKITKDEMNGVKHHLIDVFDPDFSCDVTLYKQLCEKCINDITKRGRIPIMVGGTGFYIQAVAKDIDFKFEDTENIHNELTEFYETFGEDALFERLRKVDEKTCANIPKQNIKKIIRALEFYEYHGYPISEHNEEQRLKETPYNLAFFVLNKNRAALYESIDRRVDEMMNKGLLEEVQNLINKYTYNSSSGYYNAIGYKELFEYFDHKCTLEDAIAKIKQNSRHYAKKQITFFKREKDTIWLDKDVSDDEELLSKMINTCKERGIINE